MTAEGYQGTLEGLVSVHRRRLEELGAGSPGQHPMATGTETGGLGVSFLDATLFGVGLKENQQENQSNFGDSPENKSCMFLAGSLLNGALNRFFPAGGFLHPSGGLGLWCFWTTFSPLATICSVAEYTYMSNPQSTKARLTIRHQHGVISRDTHTHTHVF